MLSQDAFNTSHTYKINLMVSEVHVRKKVHLYVYMIIYISDVGWVIKTKTEEAVPS